MLSRAEIAKNFDLLLYDFDGVIVDSTKVKYQLFVTLAQESCPRQVWEQFMAALNTELVGAERSRIAEWLKLKVDGFSSENFLREFAERLAKAENNVTAIPGVKQFLSFAYEQGLNQVILSNAPRFDICKLMALCGISDKNFLEICGSESGNKVQNGSRVMKNLGIGPSRVLFFGDMPSDLAASRALGTKFVRVQSFWGELCPWGQNNSDFPTVESYELI